MWGSKYSYTLFLRFQTDANSLKKISQYISKLKIHVTFEPVVLWVETYPSSVLALLSKVV